MGIVTVIEPHLNGTHLDGAAFFINNTRPVVALTLRYDRLDNFWFVLFHELAHIKLHLRGNDNVIFDDLDTAPDGNVIESQADKFASDNLIPESKWDNALFLMKPTITGIERFARQLNIHPAIVAGRIRRENKNYSIFSELVGSGKVRKLFILGNE
ncbi:ImmA/IrrE family metallo-endopeptidase [Nostocales cyanobacterium LEGE 12452]|nr:ImmA/IrrE family metallo-endopeptidase [Nostocales cyanobacterium LEGE 12452]